MNRRQVLLISDQHDQTIERLAGMGIVGSADADQTGDLVGAQQPETIELGQQLARLVSLACATG
jgi:hypothetical protein